MLPLRLKPRGHETTGRGTCQMCQSGLTLCTSDRPQMPKSRAHAVPFRQALALFAIFGHPIRVVMFQRLARKPMTAGELAKTLPVGRTAVVQHLKRMEAARLVDALPSGKRRLYRIRAEGLEPFAQWLENHRPAPSTKRRDASTNAPIS